MREANKDYYYCSAGKYCIILDTGLKLSGRLSLLTHYKSVSGIGIYIAGLHSWLPVFSYESAVGVS